MSVYDLVMKYPYVAPQVMRVNYITSTSGSADLKELFKGNATKIEVDITLTSNLGYNNVFENAGSANSNSFIIRRENNPTSLYFRYGVNNTIYTVGSAPLRTVVMQDKNVLYIDGVLKRTSPVSSFISETPSTINFLNCLFHGCKIWEDDVMKRDWIPALDGSNNPCIFDNVTGEYIYSTSTVWTYELL